MKILYYLFLIIFFQSKFISKSTKDAIKKEFESNKQLLSAYPDRQLLRERENEFKKGVEDSTKLLREAIIKSFSVIIITMGLAIALGFFLKFLGVAINQRIVNVIQLFSACLFFVSVWGKLDWEIQTCGGNTLPEIVNKKWSNYLFLSATFILILSYFL